jgi:hypothetical protein
MGHNRMHVELAGGHCGKRLATETSESAIRPFNLLLRYKLTPKTNKCTFCRTQDFVPRITRILGLRPSFGILITIKHNSPVILSVLLHRQNPSDSSRFCVQDKQIYHSTPKWIADSQIEETWLFFTLFSVIQKKLEQDTHYFLCTFR